MKILTVIGARPQFIKMAPVSRAMAASGKITDVVVHTGQHFDDNMSGVFFRELDIAAPQYNLSINGGGHGAMTGRMMEGLEPIILQEKPDAILVYGDTNSTLAGALVAAKALIPVAHVEAGLRSWNRAMPEEINRVLTDHVSTWLFCPTQGAVANLAAEGITGGVHAVGDVMYDATLHAAAKSRSESEILQRLGVEVGSYVLATVHRAENTGSAERLSQVIGFLKKAAAGQKVILPLHPRTRETLLRTGLTLEGLEVIEPVGYIDMNRLLSGCTTVITDSGGLQKEAYFHRKPCITLRDETEWVETIESGWNKLWTQAEYVSPRRDITDYGQGDTARKIVEVLLNAL